MMAAEAAVGRLLSSEERAAWPQGALRSAFVISNTHVLSAWHCVQALGGTSTRAWLRLQPRNAAELYVDVPVKYEAHRPDMDAALLTVDRARFPEVGDTEAVDSLLVHLAHAALPLGCDVYAHERVRIGGFPERNPARYPTLFSGKVESANALIGGAQAIRVFVPEFAARYAERPDGMSGGPLLRRSAGMSERVVGIVSSYPQAHGDQGATGGTVLCRRIRDLSDDFPVVGGALRRAYAAELAHERGAADDTGWTPRTGASGRVYISSASGPLDPYRTMAAEICRRHGLIPVLPGDFSPGAPASMSDRRREIDSCQIFVLLLADRYGDCPPEEALAYTELEYDWASRSQDIVIVPFQAVEGMPWSGLPGDPAELPEHAAETMALNAFTERVGSQHEVIPFWDLSNFRLDLYQALEPYKSVRSSSGSPAHFGSWPYPWHKDRRILPSPPSMCAMPAYVGGTPFTGRGHELGHLDEWARSEDPVMVVEAIGGTGKSALTWEWVTSRAKSAVPELAGSFWWSFYDGAASMERFLQELLAYLRATSARDISRIEKSELPALVLNELCSRPFLIVLDGFERLLMAYHQYDPSKVTDDDVDEDRRANKHSMIDATAYEFVRRLVTASPSKILISTRMVPDALERPGGGLLPGARRHRLPGLSDADTFLLLRRLGVDGGADEIEGFFGPLGNHPLLIAIVAGMVRDYRPAPGVFDEWLKGQPFEIRRVKLAARRHHILSAALAGLDPEEDRLLGWLSVLSGSVHWDVLESINPYLEADATSPATAGALLDAALRDLEVRGLIWWNRRANTYDMHPVVRAFAHARLDSRERIGANRRLRDYFQALPPEKPDAITSVEDLQQTIALFRALTGAQQYNSAASVWADQLADPLLVNLGANSSIAELLQPYEQTNVVSVRADLSISLHLAGRHERGLAVELQTMEYLLETRDTRELRICLGRAATHYRSMGKLATHANVLILLPAGKNDDGGLTLALRKAILDALRGNSGAALRALNELAHTRAVENNPWFSGDVRYWKLVINHWLGDGPGMSELANAERNFSNWRSRLRLADLKFELLMERGEYLQAKAVADDIDRLRRVGGQEVIPAENAMVLAHLGRRDDAAEAIAECIGAMPRVHFFDRPYYRLAVALRTLGRNEDSAEMAVRARRRAWADGPDFSYHWDLRRADTLLTDLGVPLVPLLDAKSESSTIPHQDMLERLLQ